MRSPHHVHRSTIIHDLNTVVVAALLLVLEHVLHMLHKVWLLLLLLLSHSLDECVRWLLTWVLVLVDVEECACHSTSAHCWSTIWDCTRHSLGGGTGACKGCTRLPDSTLPLCSYCSSCCCLATISIILHSRTPRHCPVSPISASAGTSTSPSPSTTMGHTPCSTSVPGGGCGCRRMGDVPVTGAGAAGPHSEVVAGAPCAGHGRGGRRRGGGVQGR